ncbi:hypothetical protein K443DRAFT_572376 [Laccaria amethystina LaAM-08-1]|uniref:Uncharacterized protein n=1 Tax=Laccaria amethystina LaAM-08-1 TaxID=1095629 RepID=A0A0C9XUG1_9AGAR|nr:hypothetical protein K443DRAFT_572376 [Laccaria amethystina LaAM-08-1]
MTTLLDFRVPVKLPSLPQKSLNRYGLQMCSFRLLSALQPLIYFQKTPSKAPVEAFSKLANDLSMYMFCLHRKKPLFVWQLGISPNPTLSHFVEVTLRSNALSEISGFHSHLQTYPNVLAIHICQTLIRLNDFYS